MLIPRDNYIYSMDKNNSPVAKVDLPATLVFETFDCYHGQVKSPKDTAQTINFSHTNPATGPVYLEGVKAGDVIAVHILRINIKSPGLMMARPGAGVMKDMVAESQILMLPIENDHVKFKGINIPNNPMIGVIGVAPESEMISCRIPGSHGGNMDTNLIGENSTVYLPVKVDGGLLAIGDLHAAMGNGEVMTSGVEVSGEVEVTIEKIADLKLLNPLVVNNEAIATIASAETLDEAVIIATKEMNHFLLSNTSLSFNEAGMLMSCCGNAEISQVVNPLKTARFTMPRWVMKELGVAIA